MEDAPPSERKSGLFLALEGVEGSGKTTQVALLAEWLRGLGHDVVVAREPGSTPLGERVRATVLDEVAACNAIATGGVTPHATVLLDVDADVGAGGQRAAGKSADRMEREDAEFHRRVAAAYREHAARVAGIVRVDADAPRDEVQRRVRAALAARFPETFAGTGFISQ